MSKCRWQDLSVGDFFVTRSYENNGDDYSLYQKLDHRAHPYNAVLINTGQVCCVHELNSLNFERVEATFSVKQ